MEQKTLTLEIMAPDKPLFKGEVLQVTLPGRRAPFTVLYNHAPLLSSLSAGKICWKDAGGGSELVVDGGFVEVYANTVTVCVETAK